MMHTVMKELNKYKKSPDVSNEITVFNSVQLYYITTYDMIRYITKTVYYFCSSHHGNLNISWVLNPFDLGSFVPKLRIASSIYSNFVGTCCWKTSCLMFFFFFTIVLNFKLHAYVCDNYKTLFKLNSLRISPNYFKSHSLKFFFEGYVRKIYMSKFVNKFNHFSE